MFLFVLYIFLSSMGLILFKLGSSGIGFQISEKIFSFSMSWLMLLGIFCYMFSFILWLVIVSKSQLSMIYPVSIACINITLLFGSYFILNEQITWQTILGTAIIIAGVIIMKWS